ncbi:MAG: protein TolQ [Candidatus Andeanibacterium colombiense]|uniref:Protein TolQ n=1 Tax=Candidatus Andeanibacterium colombiense TaxID=3121345 RepID=A0AAJ6BQP4_9SPHN|nr:MAG: protein TolQ [Sphingomonadaceae bacterium]
MTDLSFLAAAAAETPTRLDPIKLFLDADIVVQVVMLGLLAASVWSWTIIVSFRIRIGGLRRRCDDFESEFFQLDNPDALLGERRRASIPSAAIAAAGLGEFRKSVALRSGDREGARQRIATALDSRVAAESDELGARLNFLATTGAVAPFVGLFGTVWGIMNSFFDIGQQQNSSLAVVAPGISEALFATAIGLFAAIPAVIAYNRYSNRVNLFESRLQRFADRYHSQLSRDLEKN